jgi:co-chaperonin GroES (HSP10)
MTISGTEEWLKFDIEPNGNRIYVYLDDIPKQSGLVIMIDEQATPSRIGTIVKVGPEVNRPTLIGGEPPLPSLFVGDRVLIGCHSGVNLYLWQFGLVNERWKICTRSEVLAKVISEP